MVGPTQDITKFIFEYIYHSMQISRNDQFLRKKLLKLDRNLNLKALNLTVSIALQFLRLLKLDKDRINNCKDRINNCTIILTM